MRKVRLELRLIGFHLFENLFVVLRNWIGDRRGDFAGFGVGLVWKRTARQHLRKLSRVVRPCGEDLRALIKIVLPNFVERVGLAVMRFGVFGAVLNTEKARDPSVVEGRMIRAKCAGD